MGLKEDHTPLKAVDEVAAGLRNGMLKKLEEPGATRDNPHKLFLTEADQQKLANGDYIYVAPGGDINSGKMWLKFSLKPADDGASFLLENDSDTVPLVVDGRVELSQSVEAGALVMFINPETQKPFWVEMPVLNNKAETELSGLNASENLSKIKDVFSFPVSEEMLKRMADEDLILIGQNEDLSTAKLDPRIEGAPLQLKIGTYQCRLIAIQGEAVIIEEGATEDEIRELDAKIVSPGDVVLVHFEAVKKSYRIEIPHFPLSERQELAKAAGKKLRELFNRTSKDEPTAEEAHFTKVLSDKKLLLLPKQHITVEYPMRHAGTTYIKQHAFWRDWDYEGKASIVLELKGIGDKAQAKFLEASLQLFVDKLVPTSCIESLSEEYLRYQNEVIDSGRDFKVSPVKPRVLNHLRKVVVLPEDKMKGPDGEYQDIRLLEDSATLLFSEKLLKEHAPANASLSERVVRLLSSDALSKKSVAQAQKLSVKLYDRLSSFAASVDSN